MTEMDDILFGRIALRNGFVTEEQLRSAIKIQRSSKKPRRLGEILLEMGYISSDEVKLIIRSQGMRLDKPHKRLKTRRREVLFGAVAVRLGFATQQQINEAVREQAQLKEQGKEVPPLGEILLKKGVLTLSQIKTILSWQRKHIMVCQGCSRRYNVVNPVPTKQPKCPECGSMLVEPATIDTPKVDASVEEEIPPGAICIGDYIILEEISRGGMGVVYKARKKGTNFIVALKMLLDDAESLEEEITRFENEAKAIAQLIHPNIITIHELYSVGGKRFFSMEYIEGKTLGQIISEGGMSLDDTLSVVRSLAEALDYAHSQKVYHRDVKPSNIMIEDKTSRVVLMDFGLAIRQKQRLRLTKTGFTVGTPLYMPPESASGANIEEYDPRSDIYSLGSVFYELLAGRPPFEAESPIEVLVKKMNEDPPPVSSFNPSIPKAVERIVMRCIARNIEERYPSARHLADEIVAYQRKTHIRNRRKQFFFWVARVVAVSASVAAISYSLYTVTNYIHHFY